MTAHGDSSSMPDESPPATRRRRTRVEILDTFATLVDGHGEVPAAHEIEQAVPGLLDDSDVYFVSLDAVRAALRSRPPAPAPVRIEEPAWQPPEPLAREPVWTRDR